MEHVFSLYDSAAELDEVKLREIIQFVRSAPDDSSIVLEDRGDAEGVFYAFSIKITLNDLLKYNYNPDLPTYLISPSSIQDSQWLDHDAISTMKTILEKGVGNSETTVIRGQDSETTTPDATTGGYYSYKLDRAMVLLKDPTGPFFFSASRQSGPSEVGKKGCIPGDGNNWHYFYSNEVGINKLGLSWVESFIYSADSLIVYIPDSSTGTVKVGLFKWLNAGWKGLNMVNSDHILEGIERFAHSFKEVFEKQDLPDAETLAKRYRTLLTTQDEQLRNSIQPFIAQMLSSKEANSCTSEIKKKLESGEYLNQMSTQEMARIIMLDEITSPQQSATQPEENCGDETGSQ